MCLNSSEMHSWLNTSCTIVSFWRTMRCRSCSDAFATARVWSVQKRKIYMVSRDLVGWSLISNKKYLVVFQVGFLFPSEKHPLNNNNNNNSLEAFTKIKNLIRKKSDQFIHLVQQHSVKHGYSPSQVCDLKSWP